MRNSIFSIKKKKLQVFQPAQRRKYLLKNWVLDPALTRDHLKMSLCHRGHTTKKVSRQGWEPHKKEKNTTQCRVLNWTILQSVPLNLRVNPQPAPTTFASNICFFCAFWLKGDVALDHSIMERGKLEGTPHCLLFLKSHACFPRIYLKNTLTQPSKRNSRTVETENRTGHAQGLSAAERKLENRYRKKPLLLKVIYSHL